MDYKFKYKLKKNILFLFVEGDYSAQEFKDFLENALNDSQIPQRFGVVIDARRSKAAHKIDEVKQIHAMLTNWKERMARMAIVVQSNMHFGFTRQSSVYTEFFGLEVYPFRDIESAIDWVKEKLDKGGGPA